MTWLLDYPLALCGLLALLSLGGLELGRAVAPRRADGTAAPGNAADGLVAAVLGFLLALSLTGGLERFDARRHLIVDEANAIGTAYLRIDLAPAEAQPALRDAFRRYVDSRIDAYRVADDDARFTAGLARSAVIQREVWRLATAAGRRPDAMPAANMLMLPAINEMIDLTATRNFARLMHPPLAVYYLLVVLTVLGAVLAGAAMADSPRDWLRVGCFVGVTTMVLFVTIDLEFPRLGIIRVDGFEGAVIASRN